MSWNVWRKETDDWMGPKLRASLVISIIVFTISLAIFVSIPDYCYNAPPWAIMLWGEASQWWSEITWLILFGIFSIALVFVLGWSNSIRDKKVESYLRLFRIAFLVAFLSLLWNFSALYFRWDGWANSLLLDRSGYLHGVFYLGVALQGLWLFGELIGLVSKIVPRLRDVQFSTR